MTSKKPAASKRAKPARASDYTKDFLKDWRRLSHSGRYDMNRLKEAMTLLIANDGPLPPEWLDHPLTGDWAGHRECHIGGDFLLIYTLDDSGKAAWSFSCAAGRTPSFLVARKESRLAERGGERLRAVREENAATRQSP
jgi:addiction module toxin, RelE/StbE family